MSEESKRKVDSYGLITLGGTDLESTPVYRGGGFTAEQVARVAVDELFRDSEGRRHPMMIAEGVVKGRPASIANGLVRLAEVVE